MGRLRRPDGAELQWEAHGEGPKVVVADMCYSPPTAVAGLVGDLARDHTVVTYHLRGTGDSSRVGPYDLDTDAADLGAVIEETGAPAVAVGLADGCNRAVRLATRQPDLISHVIAAGTPAFGEVTGLVDALSGSRSVLRVLLQLFESDYRSALRTMITTGDPSHDDASARARTDAIAAYSPQDVTLARMRAWIGDREDLENARSLGARLVILHHDRNPWFSGDLLVRLRELLPSARFEAVDDGALARPDLTAAAVRALPR